MSSGRRGPYRRGHVIGPYKRIIIYGIRTHARTHAHARVMARSCGTVASENNTATALTFIARPRFSRPTGMMVVVGRHRVRRPRFDNDGEIITCTVFSPNGSSRFFLNADLLDIVRTIRFTDRYVTAFLGRTLSSSFFLGTPCPRNARSYESCFCRTRRERTDIVAHIVYSFK